MEQAPHPVTANDDTPLQSWRGEGVRWLSPSVANYSNLSFRIPPKRDEKSRVSQLLRFLASLGMTRTTVLQLAGFTVLHFTDEEVLNNLTQVQEKILGWIEE